jgi:hypothetical protein
MRLRAAGLLIRIGMLVLLLTLACGCVDYEEEMWLDRDLSGWVTMMISVREELVKGGSGMERDLSEEGVRRDVERIPGVKLESYESFREAGKMIARLRLKFDSVEKLTRHESHVTDSSPASFLGAIHVRKENGKILFERTLRAMPETKSNSSFAQDLFAKSLSSLFLSNNYLTYKLHVPGELITANSQRIDNPNHTVEWKFTLAQAMREPPVMRAEWKKGFLPAGAIWIVGALVILLIGLWVFATRAARKPPV